MEPKISIIIPIYNENSQIIPLLDNLDKACVQLPQQPEIIFADGGSTDGSIKLMKEQLQMRTNPSQVFTGKRGRGQQLAAASNIASGDILVFLHADTRITGQYFKEMLTAINNGAQWGCARLHFDNDKLSLKLIAYFSHLRVRYQSLVFGDQTMFCLKNFYAQVGGFAPMFFMEDYEFSQRAARLAKPVELTAIAISSARQYMEHGIWRTNWRIQKNKHRYRSGKYTLEELYQLYAQ